MLIKSQIVTQASGSIGGLTASRNRGGLYFRARAIPVNPGSSQQVAVRNLMAVLNDAWISVLTGTQRLAWKTYAENTPVIGPLGDPITLSGINMYQRGNVAALQAGLTRRDDAPTVFDLGSFSEPTIAAPDATADTVDISFNNLDAWANEDGAAMLVYVSRPQNATINFFKGPYRLAGSILGDAVTPPTSPATITLPFPVAAGNKVFVQITVTRADGRYSSPFRGDNVAA